MAGARRPGAIGVAALPERMGGIRKARLAQSLDLPGPDLGGTRRYPTFSDPRAMVASGPG